MFDKGANRIAAGLGAAGVAAIWLMPNHQLPWQSFHHEWVAAIVLGVTLLVTAKETRWPMQLPAVALVFLMAAMLPLIQWAGGILVHFGTALVSASYAGAVGLAVALGYASGRYKSEQLFFVLMGGLAISALLNVPVQLIQWFQFHADDLNSFVNALITPVQGGLRPSGMLLQPNQLATIQVWGLVALSWLRYKNMLGAAVYAALFGVVTIGIGLTQSRAGILEVAVVLALLVHLRSQIKSRAVLWAWAVALLLLVVWSFYFQEVAGFLGVVNPAEGRLSAIDGARIDAWKAFIGAVLQSPWVGYGISDSAYAYFALAESRPHWYIGQRFGHAHNLVIDLALWVGIPLALLLTLVSIIWLWRRLRDLRHDITGFFPMAMVATLLVHAMLELPHHFLYFLFPLGVALGWLSALSSAGTVIRLPSWLWAACGVVVLCVAGVVAKDYLVYQERYTEWRFENLRIGTRPDIPVLPPLVLDQIHDELTLYRLVLDGPVSNEQLKWIEDAVRGVPTPPAIYAAVKANALAGKPERALTWMYRYNAIMSPALVTQTQGIWARDQIRFPELRNVNWPPYMGRRSTFKLEEVPASPDKQSSR